MKSNILNISKYLLAALFIYAGFYKITDITLFRTQLFESPLLPPALVPVIAILLPPFEIVLGILIIFVNRLASLTMAISTWLMLFFTFYLIILYSAYAKPPCACGGILSGMTYPVHILFNGIFTIIAMAGHRLATISPGPATGNHLLTNHEPWQ